LQKPPFSLSYALQSIAVLGKPSIFLMQGVHLLNQSVQIAIVIDDIVGGCQSGMAISLAIDDVIDLFDRKPITLPGALNLVFS